MTSRSRIAPSHAAAALGCCTLAFVSAANGQVKPSSTVAQTSETMLYSFKGYLTGGLDGIGPNPIIQAGDGNFYGTTFNGGTADSDIACSNGDGDGTFFRVTPTGEETVLYSFRCGTSGNSIGGLPSSPLVIGKDGALYGTSVGGDYYTLFHPGDPGVPGSVFKFTLSGQQTVLHTFAQPSGTSTDGQYPAGLLLAKDGNFYGVTQYGGANNAGVVFKMTPSGQETVLHTFSGSVAGSVDGAYPWASLIQATDGNLYGTTYAGGAYGAGTVFRITPEGAESVLYSFTYGVNGSQDGAQPAYLIQAGDGSLYGVTFGGGGQSQNGTVFRVTLAGEEKVIYAFAASDDGNTPDFLMQNDDGTFYGATLYGGTSGEPGGAGTVFQLTTEGTENIVYSFRGQVGAASADGAGPNNLFKGTDGSFYGSTLYGGTEGFGTIFKLSIGAPLPAAPVFSPAPGTYFSTQTVTLSDATPGVTLYYTLAGYPPTTSSTRYTGPITVSATENIQAVAVAGGTAESAVTSGFYSIIEPTTNIYPGSLTFPSTVVGATAGAQTLTLQNIGSLSVNIGAIALGGGQADDFALKSTCGTTLAYGAHCTVTVTFKPVSTGVKSASVVFTDNAVGSPQIIPLNGTGVATAVPQILLSSTSIAFPDSYVGSLSGAYSVTLTNPGTVTLNLGAITLSGGQADDFLLSTTCGTSLAPNASCVVSVMFQPVSTGTKSAKVSISDDAGHSPQIVALSGASFASPTGPVLFSTNSLAFGNQAVGTSSGSQSISITNNGSQPTAVTSMKLQGGQPDDFLVTPACGAIEISRGFGCSISVAFKPVSKGKKAASLTIAVSGVEAPQVVALTGTGT